MNKKKFKCVCGHKEDHHNFDPNSYFFGCCERFIATSYHKKNKADTMITCKCNEFRPDNLRYLEELSDR